MTLFFCQKNFTCQSFMHHLKSTNQNWNVHARRKKSDNKKRWVSYFPRGSFQHQCAISQSCFCQTYGWSLHHVSLVLHWYHVDIYNYLAQLQQKNTAIPPPTVPGYAKRPWIQSRAQGCRPMVRAHHGPPCPGLDAGLICYHVASFMTLCLIH